MARQENREYFRRKILKAYLGYVKRYETTPSISAFAGYGISRNQVRWAFGTWSQLRKDARKAAPELFKTILDENSFTDENFGALERIVEKHRKFVITCAVAGCRVHAKFLKALKSYCQLNDALLLIIPVEDPAFMRNEIPLDKRLAGEVFAFGDLELNSNIHISGIKMSAKQIDPTTGLDRLAQNCSFVYGSPKQRMKVVPNQKYKLPHVLMGTGAVTVANYMTDRYLSKRTAVLAENDHKLGALVVELDSDEKYYFRQLQAVPADGSFIDLGIEYLPNGKTRKAETLGFVMGDLHPGETDPIAFATWKEVCKELKPKNIIIHDGFNGHSISHWVEGKIIEKARMAQRGLTSLSAEFYLAATYYEEIASWATEKVIDVYSNHNDFLPRYLDSGRFMKDHENFKEAIELASVMMSGENPTAYGIRSRLSDKAKDKVVFLKEDQSFKLVEIEVGAHGDRGPNGSKGTLSNLERSYRSGVFGHSHTPGILREAWQVGHTTHDASYAKGPSSWMFTSCAIYENGGRQLINSIGGKWRLKKVVEKMKKS